jgi:16S rRNA processing protein RimM
VLQPFAMTNPKSKIQNPKSDDWLEIGIIVSPQGLKGELRVYSNSDFPERFEQPGVRWLLRPNATEPEAVELLSGRWIPGKGVYIIRLAGVENCDQAETLRDCKLLVKASDRLPLEEDEYHVRDLVGLEVFNQETDESIGIVVDIYSAGNDLLVVNRPSLPVSSEEQPKPDKQLLIPFVKEIVPVVDIEQGRIEITPPPGLLEIES